MPAPAGRRRSMRSRTRSTCSAGRCSMSRRGSTARSRTGCARGWASPGGCRRSCAGGRGSREIAARARPRTAHEPWREKLWYVQARLRAAVDHGDEGYVDADEYVEDLELLDRTLRAAGFAAVADHELRDAIRRAEVFGFHLAS